MKAIIDLFQEYAEQCAAELGTEDKLFSLGGRGVRLRFAGGRWAAILTKALRHLETREPSSPGHRQLTVCVLDGSVPPRNPLLRCYLKPLVDFWPQYTGPRGELLNIHGGSIAAFYQPGPDLLSIVDRAANLGFYWKRDLSPPPYYEAGSPMRSLLHAWMVEQGVQFVHGGAVGNQSGGVLLAGKGGSGKSTSVLACLNSGLKYLSDDYCMVTADDGGQPHLFSLYNTAKLLGSADLARFPQLQPHVWNPDRGPHDKVTIFLHEAFPQTLISQFPLRAILVPRISGLRDTRIQPCSHAEALMALGPSSLAQLPTSGPRDLDFIGRLVRRTPCFRMDLGADLAQIPCAILQLLGQLNG